MAASAGLARDDLAIARTIPAILELLAGAEAWLLGGLDGDFLTGLGITPLAAGAGGHHEDAEAGETHLVPFLQRGGDDVEGTVHRLGGVVLGQARRIRKLLDQVVLVHGRLLFVTLPCCRRV